MRRSLAVALGLTLCLVAGCDRPESAHAAGPAAPPPAVARTAQTPAGFPIPVIELTGDAASIGSSHANQLAEPIHYLFEKYLKPWFKSDAQRFVALTAATMFQGHLSPEHRAEVQALAKASNLDEREVMLAQCFLDLAPNVACSTITLPASASPDGVARFGRNLDFPSKGVADKTSVVMVYRPAGRYQFAAVSWPGLVGVLSGMNEHGLSLANMELPRGRRVPQAMPYTLLYRTVLEQCKTVGEAVELLQKTPRQTANNLMLMDATGDRAVVEVAPDGVTVRRAPDTAALVSTNHTRGDSDLDTPGRCRRYDRLHAAAAEGFGRIDEAAVEAMLASTGQGDRCLQSMVFEPATRTILLSVGASAHKGPFHALDLGPYFSARR